jgi:quinoprotein glucose dehydrogenase
MPSFTRPALLLLAALAAIAGQLPAAELAHDDAAQRALLPEYQTIPAAATAELTPANGWPVAAEQKEWSRSLGGPTSDRYSALNEITRANVAQLQVAWTWRAGDGGGDMQCNPIVVDGVLYTPTPGRSVAAIDAATGKELWRTDLGLKKVGGYDVPARRGLLYWPGTATIPARLYFPGARRVIALEAKTGARVVSFGDQGSVVLPAGSTAGGALYKDVLVIPGFDRDLYGFDVVSGKTLWTFNTTPKSGQPGGDTWVGEPPYNAANCWGGMALDESRGIAYITTGSPKPNFNGSEHLGDNLYCNCVLAVKADTGAYLWHFQEIRHDIWDLDMAAPPNLVTVTRDGKRVDAVAAVSKLGNTLLLDRVTGKPLFPVRLRRAPVSSLPGEQTSAYQPDIELPEPFLRIPIRREDLTERTPAAKIFVEQLTARATFGWFEAFTEAKPTVFSGTHGGAEWTGAAVDLPSGRLYVSVNHQPHIITVFRDDDPPPAKPASAGEQLFLQFCAACHGPDRTGLGVAPPLRGLRHRLDDAAVRALWKTGRNLMPPAPPMTAEQSQALLDFLMARDRSASPAKADPGAPPRYSFNGYRKLLDQEGYPGIKPPWGTLACIDLNSGRKLWQVPLGEFPELTKAGLPKTGTENFGGPSVTAGGLVFCSGTKDNRIRAFDSDSGAELWSAELPYHGSTMPTIYEAGGRQFVVIPATGGGKIGGPDGDAWVAFALPR